jgi:methyl-accepting chemotaxis protein
MPLKSYKNPPSANYASTDFADLSHEINNNVKNNIKENKENDEFLINAFHELKTPLNIIYSATQLIDVYLKTDNKEQYNDKIFYNVNSIIQNCFRLMKVINNILDLSKIEEGALILDYSYVNIVEVIENVVQTVSETIKYKHLNFIFDTNIEEKYMIADVEYIQRVLLNLLSNAVKFSNIGGEIFVSVISKGNTLEIAVTDKGIGIDKEHLDNIFSRFGLVDKSLSRRAEGSGMGLKLSKEIINAHGGSIHVFSKLNEGSTFIIKLPCKKNDAICPLYGNKIMNYDSLKEMIKIEFSDIQ